MARLATQDPHPPSSCLHLTSSKIASIHHHTSSLLNIRIVSGEWIGEEETGRLREKRGESKEGIGEESRGRRQKGRGQRREKSREEKRRERLKGVKEERKEGGMEGGGRERQRRKRKRRNTIFLRQICVQITCFSSQFGCQKASEVQLSH